MEFYRNPSHDTNFASLFRLLDDFDNYKRGSPSSNRSRKAPVPSFTPKFDVIETEHAYELYGELPGVDRNDITTEFTDPQTIVVAGSVIRRYDDQSVKNSHNATVEDVTDKPEQADEAKAPGGHDTQQVSKKDQPSAKYWVNERSIGDFSRTFTFPGRIDQDAVSANLQNGILKIVVPKVKKMPHRRIAINVN